MNNFSITMNVGDGDFPLEVNLKHDIDYKHRLVGHKARVTPYAKEALIPCRGKKGTIEGVIEKNGAVLGFKVEVSGKTFYAPKKDFYVGRQLLEDIHIDTPYTQHVKTTLSHYQEQHDYYGSCWGGIEKLYFALAKCTDECHIESPGWYKYDSSKRSDMDGKNWRMLLRDNMCVVSVNCHSLLHDKVWTLATTVFSTREVDQGKLKFEGSPCHWTKTLMWSLKTAEILESDGYDYSEAKKDLQERLDAVKPLMDEAAQILPGVVEAFKKVKKMDPNLPAYSIGFSDIRVPPESIGVHEPPSDLLHSSVITIDPSAMGRPKYISQILKHELIHYLLETQCSDETHSEDFHDIADEVGLPEKFRH